MKKFLNLLTPFILSFCLLGCVEEPKEIVYEDWQPVEKKHIEQYFKKLDNEALSYCEVKEESVWDKEEGFKSERWDGWITNVYSDYDFEWTNDGEYINVNMYCDYDVYYKFGLNYFKDELHIFANSFRMKKYYNQETKALVALNFE